MTGKSLSFDWLEIQRPTAPENESDEEDDDEPFVDDPFGLNRLASNYMPARIGAKRFTVDPESVAVNDFVIVRAKADEEDGSCFRIANYDVPVWLCKARSAPHRPILQSRKTRNPRKQLFFLVQTEWYVQARVCPFP